MNITKLKETAKRILAIPVIRKTKIALQTGIYRVLSVSKLLAVPYHLIFSRKFDREIFAFTRAIRQYNYRIRHTLPSNILIRRNIHRLEKGLIMENRRSIFALDYITETMESYARIVTAEEDEILEAGEMQWAHDVLAAYFEVTDKEHPIIRSARELFNSLPKPQGYDTSQEFVPYASNKLDNLKIPTYAEFIALCEKRRSVRWFEDKKVPRELVDQAVYAASLSPSACNRQPFYYRIFDDPELVHRIASIPFGTAGFSHNFPMIAVIVGDMSNYFAARDRHVIYIDSALSIMAFIQALETLGLSSVTINCQDVSLIEYGMKKNLELKAYERPILMVAIGYAKQEGMIPYSKKKPVEALRSYN